MNERYRAVVGVHWAPDCTPVVIAFRGEHPRIILPGMSECPIPPAEWAWGRSGRGCAYLAWHILALLGDDDLAVMCWADYAAHVVSRLHPSAFVITADEVERFVVGVICGFDPAVMLDAAHFAEGRPDDN